MDAHGVRALSGIHSDALLSGLFRKLLRRQALRSERRIAAHGFVYAAPLVPQLVSTALPVRLRNLPLRRGLSSRPPAQAPDRARPRKETAMPDLQLQHVSEFAADVRESLTKPGQRELPSKYLYDEVGSTLFEAICLLPEYGLTRADTRLLQENAAEIVSRIPSPVRVAELGSGSGKKTRWILEALSRRQITYYYPIEISPHALAACEKELAQIDMLSVVGYEQPYLEGLRSVAEGRSERDHVLVLFLGRSEEH